MCAFRDTPNKAAIRQQWDQPILARFHDKKGTGLTYFGLPGPDIHDLLDWRDLLDSARTGVESPGHTKMERYEADQTIGRLNLNIMVNGLGSGFQLLVADVEDVIIDGVDSKGNRPQKNDGQAAHVAHFRYDLVNLDFDGGLGYTNQ